MTDIRIDAHYSRNEICPCEKGQKNKLKIKNCCKHLLQRVSNEDLKRDLRNANIDNNEGCKTTTMLRNLSSPNLDSLYKAQMTCGQCHGTGEVLKGRKRVGLPHPGHMECYSCKGKGWYWVNVSKPTMVSSETYNSLLTYSCPHCRGSYTKVINFTSMDAPKELICDSSHHCHRPLVLDSTDDFYPEFQFVKDEEDNTFFHNKKKITYLVELYPGRMSHVSASQLIFACYYGCSLSNIPQHVKRYVREYIGDNIGTFVERPRVAIEHETTWWSTGNRYFVPVITDPNVILNALDHLRKGVSQFNKKDQYDEFTLVYTLCDHDNYFIVKAESHYMKETVTKDHFDLYRSYLKQTYNDYSEYIIPIR